MQHEPCPTPTHPEPGSLEQSGLVAQVGGAPRGVPDLDRDRLLLDRGRFGATGSELVQRPHDGLTAKLPPPLLNTRCVKLPSVSTCALQRCPKTALARGHPRPPCALLAGPRPAPSSRRSSGLHRCFLPTAADARLRGKPIFRHYRRAVGKFLGGGPCAQGLDNVIPLPLGQTSKGAIRRHERLGGVLGHYRREAAWRGRSSFRTGRGKQQIGCTGGR
jgi:hypothetical protein